MGQAKARGVLEWEQFDITEYELLMKNQDCNTWLKKQNSFFNCLVEEYVGVICSDQELTKQKRVFEFRTRTAFIIHGLYFSYTQLDDVCSCHYRKSLFAQKIYLKLSDLSDIPVNDAMYMMIASLSGFQKLFDNFGPFRVTQDMIGIDENLHVKVWWSDNYGSANPDFPVATYSERDLATSVISMIWKHVYGKEQLEESPLKHTMRNQAKHMGIGQVLFLLGQYIVRHQINCTDKFVSAQRFVKQLTYQKPKINTFSRSARSMDRDHVTATRLLSPQPQLTNRVTHKPMTSNIGSRREERPSTIQFTILQFKGEPAALTDRSNNLFPKYKFFRKSSKRDETLQFSSSRISKNPQDSPIKKIQSLTEHGLPMSLSLSSLLHKLDHQH